MRRPGTVRAEHAPYTMCVIAGLDPAISPIREMAGSSPAMTAFGGAT